MLCFCLHGIPQDIVSDREPQFITQVWKAFSNALDSTVSLSSGFHLQTNRQAEWANQDVEAALWCVAAKNLSLSNDQLTHQCCNRYDSFCLSLGIFASSVPGSGG